VLSANLMMVCYFSQQENQILLLKQKRWGFRSGYKRHSWGCPLKVA
jgi:hypothetical protein